MGHLNNEEINEIVRQVELEIRKHGSCELAAHFKHAGVIHYNMEDIIAVYSKLITKGGYEREHIGNSSYYLMKPIKKKWYNQFGLPKLAEMLITAALALAVGWFLQKKEREDQSRQFEHINQQIDSLRHVLKNIDTVKASAVSLHDTLIVKRAQNNYVIFFLTIYSFLQLGLCFF